MEDTLVANGQFTIQNTNEYWDYYLSCKADENGQFSADIPDGNYVIETVNDANGNPIASIDLFFSVKMEKWSLIKKSVNE